MTARQKEHVHYALYSGAIIVAMLIHGNAPITGAAGKLTIMLMALLIFGESVTRMLRGRRHASASAGETNA
jgi:hypothetical protein